MSNMKDRQETFERKFVHDEELKFKAVSRRNKLLGLWAAEKMGRTGEAADAYAREVIKADFEEAGEEDVFRKIRRDFDEAGVQETDDQIRRAMGDLLNEAIDQIKNQ